MPSRQELLEALADAISREVGFETVAINTYRPDSDDYAPAVIHGSREVHDAVAGSCLDRSSWVSMLGPLEEKCGCYFIPDGTVEWPEEGVYTPQRVGNPEDPGSWLAGDGLFVAMRSESGAVVGIVSADEPRSGRRPSQAQLSYLSALVNRATRALEELEAAPEPSR